ncbi:MAG TPA: hypothetical protein PLE99_01670 [Candidatus Thiothrix moscowensis]|uniref:hypothetical protein n=1 Tax=unclassified Thiothrix TaxID=2636184 RepID=UPI0025ED45C2|nr:MULTISPECIES: hypothetical protein [unclassified Thiothrix]HRJ51446.1 hypothetical protein [Candidatus Thiothrix moscowensis]HRJ91499.1 hypothetical protein [Candidatus Thiothrix moscowensis]
MKQPHPITAAVGGLLLCATLLTGCELMPAPETETKSIQDIAAEALNSKGKLSKEQIDALIRANAKCSPNDTIINRS